MIRILIADDHALFRQGLAELLTGNRSCKVVGSANSGEEALAMSVTFRPDVILLDLSMPGLDGFDVIRRLKTSPRPPRILVLSMHNDSRSVHRALDLGADGYLLKEEAFAELLKGIGTVRSGRRFLSGSIRELLEKDHAWGGGVEALSPRERQIVARIAAGLTTKEIAAELGISVKTVETHRQHIMEKLGVRKSTQIVMEAMKAGLMK
ncbi:MAG: response regulator transcription factor [bacterium]|jgi:DNA-binding NarL/FixJ family response regulator